MTVELLTILALLSMAIVSVPARFASDARDDDDDDQGDDIEEEQDDDPDDDESLEDDLPNGHPDDEEEGEEESGDGEADDQDGDEEDAEPDPIKAQRAQLAKEYDELMANSDDEGKETETPAQPAPPAPPPAGQQTQFPQQYGHAAPPQVQPVWDPSQGRWVFPMQYGAPPTGGLRMPAQPDYDPDEPMTRAQWEIETRRIQAQQAADMNAHMARMRLNMAQEQRQREIDAHLNHAIDSYSVAKLMPRVRQGAYAEAKAKVDALEKDGRLDGETLQKAVRSVMRQWYSEIGTGPLAKRSKAAARAAEKRSAESDEKPAKRRSGSAKNERDRDLLTIKRMIVGR